MGDRANPPNSTPDKLVKKLYPTRTAGIKFRCKGVPRIVFFQLIGMGVMVIV
jgi:hypothetical protein